MRCKGLKTGLSLAAAICTGVSRAEAQEYCVSCSEPNALYRCIIENARPGGGQSLQMLCVTTMAKTGGHATCSVKRGTVFECDGQIRRIPWSAVEAPPAPTDQSNLPPPPPPPPAAAPKSDPQKPPQTMVDLAKQANEQTKEQLKQAGDNVKQSAKSVGQALGTATKKTWDCMTSLFTRC
ncbi:MAG: hypothetical protein F9K29_14165 [Hyphomicrobiaceae bacterium]|nr:MAG: hypothetical protein F9K29_14165 [Hyphomicrobiaceae bacterium]